MGDMRFAFAAELVVLEEDDDSLSVSKAKPTFRFVDFGVDGVATVEEIDQRLMEGLARQRERLLRRLDANRDRTISREEIVARTGGMFTAIDADASGGISRDEMQTYRRTSRGARRTDRDKAARQ